MKNLLLFITLLVQAVLYSQNGKINSTYKTDSLQFILNAKQKRIDSLRKIDFINFKYKYLDADYKIKIDKNTFEKITLENSPNIKSYKDSLMTVLHYELGDNNAVNIAFHRILFNWKKMSYYIWETEQRAKEIGESFGFKHPYNFLEFLKNEGSENSKKIEFLNQLKTKVLDNKFDELGLNTFEKFLYYSFKHNPDRIRDMEKYKEEFYQNKK
jgi:hypothetical protein